jgi:hypothetical protein
MTTTDDTLPRWLSTKEAALKVALWLSCQPDRALHHMRVLCELADLPHDIRKALLKPPWQRDTDRAVSAP